jgi:ornithine cyclodeaminase
MRKDCTIIGFPIESGAGRRGSLMGPDALRTAGLAETIRDLGFAVEDCGTLPAPVSPPEVSGPDHLVLLDETVAWSRAIHDAAFKLTQSDTLPIFLGGDHSMAAGTLTAVSRDAAEKGRQLFVLWLDAHPDMNTLSSTASGHLHGTPMAYAMGQASFEGIFPPLTHPIVPENVCMMGLRSIDPPERALIQDLGVEVWDMRRIDEEGVQGAIVAFLDRVRAANGLLHVSFDVDFLDPDIAPAVGTTVPGGATFREAHLIMEHLADSGLVTSLELTELNPFLDIRGKTAHLITDLTASLFGQARLGSPNNTEFPMTPPSDLAMVPFVSVANMMRLVHEIGPRKMMAEMAGYIEEDFRRWEDFDKTPRVAAHSAEGVIELMPTADDALYGFKYVNGHPANMARGYQTVTAFGVLSDVATGYPLLLSEMTVLTALRTAATSAMAAKYLAPKDAEVMAMIGNGAQCEFQALAMAEICGIKELRLYDIDPVATKKAAANLSAQGLSVVQCATPEDAVTGAQIITTCTADKRNATVLTSNMVGSGVHINAIGGDCPGKTELHADILQRSDIFVEYPEQTWVEGEIQVLDRDHPIAELWRVITGEEQGRTDALQTTLFDSVGFAMEDFSALRYVKDQLAKYPHFDSLDMLADPDEPRDLFGMLMRAV